MGERGWKTKCDSVEMRRGRVREGTNERKTNEGELKSTGRMRGGGGLKGAREGGVI